MEPPPVIRSEIELPEHLRLTPQEELWAIPIGLDLRTQPLAPESRVSSPRAALEAVMLSCLQRPPCAVSFSGGIDSSVVLALAVHVARREGLPLPIPMTNRFPNVVEADERDWQERVMAHLGLDDWEHLEWDDELDMLGPMATDILRRHGILMPFNGHFHYPLLERAAGGSLLSGIGGDELFELVFRGTAARVLFQRRRPRVRELRSVTFALAPRPVRAGIKARMRRTLFESYQWIRAPHRRRLARAYADWESHDPLRNDRALREWWWRSREVQCNVASKRVLAADFDVDIRHPYLDPDVLAACARAGGAPGLGNGSRARGFELLAGDLLPPEVLRRRSKASFGGAFWTGHARAFVARWDGTGVDRELVDVDSLRAEWSKPAPDPHSFVQLQRAWRASKP